MKPLLLLAFLLPACFCRASFAYRHFGTADGLPNSVVFRIHQDSRGFMWFGTDDGAARFDGRRFQHYRCGGRASGVLSVTEQAGLLYFANYRDMIATMPAQAPDSMHAFPASPRRPTRTIQLIADKEKLWCVDKTGAAGYLLRGQYFCVNGNLFVHKIRRLHSQLYIATDRGLYKWERNRLIALYTGEGPVVDFCADRAGNIWLACIGKICCYGNGRLLFKYRLDNGERTHLVHCGSDGRTWFAGNEKGLYYIEGTRVVKAGLPFSQRYVVNDLFEDAAGNLWVATYGDGVYCLYRSPAIPVAGLADAYIRRFFVNDKGALWIATLNDISRYEDGRLTALQLPGLSSFNPLNDIISAQHSYVLATYDKIMIMDKTGKLRSTLPISGVSLCRSLDGKIYAGNDGRLFKLDAALRSWDTIEFGTAQQRVRKILQDKRGIIWIATDSCLVRTHDLVSFQVLSVNNGLPGNKINDLCIDRTGRLWIATARGLASIDEAGKISRYDGAAGLSGKNCTALAAGAGKEVWIATSEGLYHFNGHGFTKIGMAQGLPSEHVNALLYAPDGKLWVGTVNGLIRLDPLRLVLHRPAPPAYIDQVRVNNSNSFIHPDTIYTYSSSQNNFTAYLSCIDYIHPIVFSYALNGTAWKETANPQLEFSNLPPGEYTLLVRAKNELSSWSNASAWRFYIMPPFWATTLFRIAATLLLISTILLLLRWRILTVRRREAEKLGLYKKVQALRQQSLTALLSPHFVFNALNSIQHYMNEYDKRSANEYLARFAGLVRKTMNDASQLFITLQDELDHLALYLSLEKLRFGDKLSYHIVVSPDIDAEEVFVPSLLIQPYVENAIWHGLMHKENGGSVTISIGSTDAYLEIMIEDDGIGMEAGRADTNTGQLRGTEIIRQRLDLLSELLGKPLLLQVSSSSAGNGTRVMLRIPHEITLLRNIAED